MTCFSQILNVASKLDLSLRVCICFHSKYNNLYRKIQTFSIQITFIIMRNVLKNKTNDF